MKKIPLSRGMVALVDDEDYLLLSRFKWSASKRCKDKGFYARRLICQSKGVGKSITVYMHRAILRARKDEEVDHSNCDGLDNRRKNLRLCTRTLNNANQRLRSSSKSGYKGVYFASREKLWIAKISGKDGRSYLGGYPTAQEAAHVYDAEAKKRWGSFARLNFPETIQ